MWSKRQHMNLPVDEVQNLQDIADLFAVQDSVNILRKTLLQQKLESHSSDQQNNYSSDFSNFKERVQHNNEASFTINNTSDKNDPKLQQQKFSAHSGKKECIQNQFAKVLGGCDPRLQLQKYSASSGKRKSIQNQLTKVLGASTSSKPKTVSSSNTGRKPNSLKAKQKQFIASEVTVHCAKAALSTYAVNQLKAAIEEQKNRNQKNQIEKTNFLQSEYQKQFEKGGVQVEEICHKDEEEGGIMGAKSSPKAISRNEQFQIFKSRNSTGSSKKIRFPQFEFQQDDLEETKIQLMGKQQFGAEREWFEAFAVMGQIKNIGHFSRSKFRCIQIANLMRMLQPQRWSLYGLRSYQQSAVCVQYEDEDEDEDEEAGNQSDGNFEIEKDRETVPEDRIVPVNLDCFTDWSQLCVGYIVEVYAQSMWWAAKISQVNKKSATVQYIHFPDTETDKIQEIKLIRPRVEFIGWVKRDDSEQFENVRKFQSMGFLPLSLNRVVEVVSCDGNGQKCFQIVKIVGIMHEYNEVSVQDVNSHDKNIYIVSIDSIRPANAMQITSWGQLHFEGGEFIDFFDAEKNIWIAGKTIRIIQNEKIVVEVKNQSEKIEIYELKNIRVGLEWIGGVEIKSQDQTFEIDEVGMPPLKIIQNKQTLDLKNQELKLSRQQISQIVNMDLSESTDYSFEDFEDYEKALSVDKFIFSENQKVANSWLAPKEKDLARTYDSKYMLRMYGKSKMGQYGYDVKKIISGNSDKNGINMELDISMYIDGKEVVHPTNNQKICNNK